MHNNTDTTYIMYIFTSRPTEPNNAKIYIFQVYF